jgi:hypothetical protein
MVKHGGYRVTIVDKSQVIPAPDAASTGESLEVEYRVGSKGEVC